MNRRLHTPEGVRDIIGSEYKRKISIEKQLSEIIETYGYDPIQTPSFEYFDLFGSKMGTVSSKNLYKFFDREGETIVLRPDFTPSIARCVSRYYNDRTAPLRLYYKGSVFSNQKTLRGNLNERTQIGGECIGEESIETDAEMISMIVRGLIACGLSDFGITIGHSAIFDGLMDAASFDEDTRDDIRLMIANKNYFGLEEYLEGMDIPAHLADAFSLLSNMYRSPDEFRNLLELVSDISPVSDAICYLADLYDLLTLFEVSEYVTFDLGLVSDFRYYTGIVFSGHSNYSFHIDTS